MLHMRRRIHASYEEEDTWLVSRTTYRVTPPLGARAPAYDGKKQAR